MKKLLTTGILLFTTVMNVIAQDAFCIAKDGKAATIVVDENDWKGVIRAANDLSDDVGKVMGKAPSYPPNLGEAIVFCNS